MHQKQINAGVARCCIVCEATFHPRIWESQSRPQKTCSPSCSAKRQWVRYREGASKKLCIICCEALGVFSDRRVACSGLCSLAYRRKMEQERNRTRYRRIHGEPQAKTCRGCGREFVPRSRLGVRCSECLQRKMMVPVQHKKQCQVCGNEYITSYVRSRTCSKSCGVEMSRIYARNYQRAIYPFLTDEEVALRAKKVRDRYRSLSPEKLEAVRADARARYRIYFKYDPDHQRELRRKARDKEVAIIDALRDAGLRFSRKNGSAAVAVAKQMGIVQRRKYDDNVN